MKYFTGKILCLILRSVVLSNLVLSKYAFIPQFSCLFRRTLSDFLRPGNRTIYNLTTLFGEVSDFPAIVFH